MIDYIAVLLLGVALGIFTGLVPGTHPNTVIFTSLPLYFSLQIDFLLYLSFVSGMSVSHTFHDFLPAIFLGAPEAESALSALPGGRMAVDGRGLEAFDYTVAGGITSVVVMLALLPLVYLGLEKVYGFLRPVMSALLLFFLMVIVFRSDRLLPAFTVATLSGLLGIVSFSSHVNQQFVLVPVFSGLFAVPAVLHSYNSDFELPPQFERRLSFGRSVRGGTIGFFAGMVAGTFPGLGAAVSTSFLAPLIDSREEFLAGMGGVNTSDILVSFVALLLLGKTRSGASVALQALSNVTVPGTVLLVGLSLLAVGVSAPLALRVSRLFMRLLSRVDLSLVLALVLFGIVSVSTFLAGPLGLLVLFTASCIGFVALLGNQRACCMAVLIIPAALSLEGIFL